MYQSVYTKLERRSLSVFMFELKIVLTVIYKVVTVEKRSVCRKTITYEILLDIIGYTIDNFFQRNLGNVFSKLVSVQLRHMGNI